MQPGPIELLNGIKQIIGMALLPELQSEQARAQALYATVLIDHLAARLDIEEPLLAEERAELRGLLTRTLSLLGDDDALTARLRAMLAEADAEPAGRRALSAQTDQMRRLVPALVQAAEGGSDERWVALRNALHAYIRNQHRRDTQIVQVGALGW